MYNVLKNQSSLPEDGLYMIRYHSFYPYVRLTQSFLEQTLMQFFLE